MKNYNHVSIPKTFNLKKFQNNIDTLSCQQQVPLKDLIKIVKCSGGIVEIDKKIIKNPRHFNLIMSHKKFMDIYDNQDDEGIVTTYEACAGRFPSFLDSKHEEDLIFEIDLISFINSDTSSENIDSKEAFLLVSQYSMENEIKQLETSMNEIIQEYIDYSNTLTDSIEWLQRKKNKYFLPIHAVEIKAQRRTKSETLQKALEKESLKIIRYFKNNFSIELPKAFLYILDDENRINVFDIRENHKTSYSRSFTKRRGSIQYTDSIRNTKKTGIEIITMKNQERSMSYFLNVPEIEYNHIGNKIFNHSINEVIKYLQWTLIKVKTYDSKFIISKIVKEMEKYKRIMSINEKQETKIVDSIFYNDITNSWHPILDNSVYQDPNKLLKLIEDEV